MMKLALYGRGRSEEPEWLVLLTLAVALLIGWQIQTAVVNRMQTATAGNVGVSVPARWVSGGESGAALSFTDLVGGGIFGPRVGLWQMSQADLIPATTGAAPSLADTAGAWSIRRSSGLAAYRVLKIEPVTVQGRQTMEVNYAYLAEGRQGAAGNVVPQVMEGVDTLVVANGQVYILSFAARSDDFSGLSDLRQRVLATWRLP